MTTGKGLVRRFAVKSGVSALVIVVALIVTTYQIVERMHLRMTAQTTELTANSVISPELAESVLQMPLVSGAARQRMDALTKELGREGVTAVKLWGRDGRLLFSSDPSDHIGLAFRGEEVVARALTGELGVQVTREADDETSNQFAEMGPLVEVYAPLRTAPDGPVVGVFETYTPYAAIAGEARRSTFMLSAVIALLLAGGYLMQLQIVRTAADDITYMDEEQGRLKEKVQTSLQDLEDHLVGTLQALTATVDAKDSYTASHALNVTRYASLLGVEMGLEQSMLADLERASLLHDIGKIGIPESVLNKNSGLTPDEYDVLKDHAEIGSRIVETIPALSTISEIVRHHHERWDGLGYPDGLMADEISLSARILSVADAFDAMTTDRPYRAAMKLSHARHELAIGSGTQFDPACVDALVHLIDTQGVELLEPPGHRRAHGHGHVHWHRRVAEKAAV